MPGDAAHLMPRSAPASTSPCWTPANAPSPSSRHGTVDEAVRAHEKTMPPRSTETARLLDGAVEGLLSTELPDFATADSR